MMLISGHIEYNIVLMLNICSPNCMRNKAEGHVTSRTKYRCARRSPSHAVSHFSTIRYCNVERRLPVLFHH